MKLLDQEKDGHKREIRCTNIFITNIHKKLCKNTRTLLKTVFLIYQQWNIYLQIATYISFY